VGVKVVVEVLDHAPPDLTPAERIVLVALAERCRDDTRRVLPSVDEPVRAMLLRRSGLGDSGLTKVLRRLAQRGLDVRIPLGLDGSGRALYAYDGRAAEFSVPQLREGGREGSLSIIHSPDERAASEGSEGGREGSSGWTSGHPPEPERVDERAALSLSPSEIPQPRARETLPPDQAEAVASLLARFSPDIDEDTAAAAVLTVAARAKTNLSGYLSRFSLEDLQRAAATRRKVKPDVERCEHGIANGRRINGRGSNASRLCGRCEADSPATDATEEVS
jgi:hypothetical protein